MNGYLVLARCLMDDLPMALFATHDEARDFANNLSDDDILDAARKVYGLNTSSVVGVDVVQFTAGEPEAVECVQDFAE